MVTWLTLLLNFKFQRIGFVQFLTVWSIVGHTKSHFKFLKNWKVILAKKSLSKMVISCVLMVIVVVQYVSPCVNRVIWSKKQAQITKDVKRKKVGKDFYKEEKRLLHGVKIKYHVKSISYVSHFYQALLNFEGLSRYQKLSIDKVFRNFTNVLLNEKIMLLIDRRRWNIISESPCETENGGCSHDCLDRGDGQAVCSCPCGYFLDVDKVSK